MRPAERFSFSSGMSAASPMSICSRAAPRRSRPPRSRPSHRSSPPKDLSSPPSRARWRSSEIPGIVADYARAAELAKAAGFDGVEIHAANGYLLDQFQKDGHQPSHRRYGGSIENRCRLTLEVVDAVAKIWPSSRIGVRLCAGQPGQRHLRQQSAGAFRLSRPPARRPRKLVYIHVVEGATGGARDFAPFDYAALRRAFRGAYIANNGFTRDLAIEAVESGRRRTRRLRAAVHLQSRPGRAPAPRRRAECAGRQDLLQRRRQGLHRLSDAGRLNGALVSLH